MGVRAAFASVVSTASWREGWSAGSSRWRCGVWPLEGPATSQGQSQLTAGDP